MLFRDGQLPPQKSLEIIMALFRKVTHPLYLGIVSLEVGWSLARTKEMLDVLEERGEVRPLTPTEKVTGCYPLDANVYVLCKSQ